MEVTAPAKWSAVYAPMDATGYNSFRMKTQMQFFLKKPFTERERIYTNLHPPCTYNEDVYIVIINSRV